MGKKKKKLPKAKDIIKACRAKAREEEIELHGKSSILKTTVVPSKKVYRRNKNKKIDED